MLDGFDRDFRTPLTVGIVLSLALAVVADLLLVLAQRLATPWRRAGRGTRKAAPVMGFLGDVFDFLTDGATLARRRGHPDPLPASTCSSRSCRCSSPRSSRCRSASSLGHVRTGGAVAVNIANIGRALPAFALLILAVQWVGIGEPDRVLTPVQSTPAFIAMVALAVPPMLANAYVGVAERRRRDRAKSARGMGMNGRQMLWRRRAARGDAADHGRASAPRRSRSSPPPRSPRTSTPAASAATSSTASRCTTT